jgi:hypothetical protein
MTPSSPSPDSPRPQWLADLRATASTELSWLWQGYLVRGGVTLLTSQWKAGKTTLLSLLLARFKQGGSLGGLPVSAARTLVLSEEDPSLCCQRSGKLDLDGHVCWLCRPFLGKPTREQWCRLIEEVLPLRQKLNLDLFVVDPLSAFLPGADENNAVAMLESLAPLRQLTSAGMSVLLQHHNRRMNCSPGQAARGSGALMGFVDVLIEMTWRRSAGDGSRARRLRAWSRYPGTPLYLLMELTPDGLDYLPVVETNEATDEPVKVPEALRLVLNGALNKLTRQQILDEWLPDYLPAPDGGTLCRGLNQAIATGEVCRDGTGRRNDPFRYWLPEQEKRWKENDNWWYETRERLEEQARKIQESGWHPDMPMAKEEDEAEEGEAET